MIYGTKMIYPYQEIDESGQTIDKKLELVFNPMTLIKYMNYTGKDFMADLFAMSGQIPKGLSKELQNKINKGEEINYEDISDSDLSKLSGVSVTKNLEFLINVTASMIATNAYPAVLDFGEIISSLPLFLFYDKDFTDELLKLIAFGLKKNKVIK